MCYGSSILFIVPLVLSLLSAMSLGPEEDTTQEDEELTYYSQRCDFDCYRCAQRYSQAVLSVAFDPDHVRCFICETDVRLDQQQHFEVYIVAATSDGRSYLSS